MADQKPEETFKVIDRRPFTAEGELRPDAIERERLEGRKDEKKDLKPAGASGANAEAAASAEAPKSLPQFQLLVESLAQNAAALLGGIPDPRTGQTFLDLEGARQMIDMLDALREKTRGNLSSEEDGMLLGLLGELKATFLEMSKAAVRATHERAKSKP